MKLSIVLVAFLVVAVCSCCKAAPLEEQVSMTILGSEATSKMENSRRLPRQLNNIDCTKFNLTPLQRSLCSLSGKPGPCPSGYYLIMNKCVKICIKPKDGVCSN